MVFVWYILLRTRHHRYRGPGTSLSLSLWSGGEVVVARCFVPPASCRVVEFVGGDNDAVILLSWLKMGANRRKKTLERGLNPNPKRQ